MRCCVRCSWSRSGGDVRAAADHPPPPPFVRVVTPHWTPPPPPPKGPSWDKPKIYRWENLIGPFLEHTPLVHTQTPLPPPPPFAYTPPPVILRAGGGGGRAGTFACPQWTGAFAWAGAPACRHKASHCSAPVRCLFSAATRCAATPSRTPDHKSGGRTGNRRTGSPRRQGP